MKPSFLADLKLPDPAFDDEQPDGLTLTPPQPRPKAKRPAASQRTSNPQSSGLQTLTPLLILGALGFAGWKAWKALGAHRASQEAQPNAKGKKPGDKGYASTFKFKESKSNKKGASQTEPISAIQAIPMRTMPPPQTKPATNKPSGNPKKNKKVKQSKKDAKLAKEREAQEANEINSVIAARAKAKGIADAGKTPDVGLVTTMDYDRTAEAFHNVAQWQETGKKSYK